MAPKLRSCHAENDPPLVASGVACDRMYLDFIAIETFAVGQIAKVIDTYTGLLPHAMLACLIRAIAEHYSFAPETNFMQSIKRFKCSFFFVSGLKI